MSNPFNTWLHADFFPNIDSYNIEIGKSYRTDNSSHNTVSIFDTRVSSFKTVCKIIYKPGEYATVGLDEGKFNDLISFHHVRDFLIAIEDRLGVELPELTEIYDMTIA